MLLPVKKYWCWNSSQSFHVKWSLLCRFFAVKRACWLPFLLILFTRSKGLLKTRDRRSKFVFYIYIYIYYYTYGWRKKTSNYISIPTSLFRGCPLIRGYYYMYIRWLKTLRLEPYYLIFDIWFSDIFFLIRHVLVKIRRSKCWILESIPWNPVELVFGSKNHWSAG